MLESIRNHAKSWIAKVILVLISIPFLLFGLESYLGGDASDNVLADVGDTPISQREYDIEIQNQTQRLRENLGERFDPAMVQDPLFRERVLDALVDRQVTLLDAQTLKLYATDAAVARAIGEIEAFRDKGVFSRERYEAVLRQNGRSTAQFENEVRVSIMREALNAPLTRGVFVPRASAELLASMVAQQREISWVDIPASVVPAAKIDAADIAAYYKKQAAEFTQPESVDVEYVKLDLADFARTVNISDETARAYYAANRDQYGTPEQRTASHILIAVSADAPPAERAKARARAEALMKTVTQQPARFAELARAESQDPVSAEQGGSLGSFGRGMMVKPFDDAVFSMKPGELKGPVESEFGYHLIRLDGIQPSGAPPFENVRDQVIETLRLAEAQKRFPEAAETFSNLVYESADTLAPAAKAVGVDVARSGWMSRESALPPFDHPALKKAVFAAETIRSRQNIEAIELQPGVLVSARVVAHKPAALRPLSEVSDLIAGKLRAERVAAETRKRGEALMAELGQGKESGTAWSDFRIVNRQSAGAIDPVGLKVAFSARVAKLPGYEGYALPDGSYRVLRVSRVLTPPLPEAGVLKSIESGIIQATQASDMQTWLTLLKRGHEVRVRKNPAEIE